MKISEVTPPGSITEDWDLEAEKLARAYEIEYNTSTILSEHKNAEEILDEITEICWTKFEKLVSVLDEEDLESLKRRVLLVTIDQVWKEHLYSMDHLRDSIRYQGAQKALFRYTKKKARQTLKPA